MFNSPNNSTFQFTWQALLWRLLLTLLLLLALAGPGLTIFRNVTNRSGTQAIPGLNPNLRESRLQLEAGR
jgi:hypothetical protein